MLAITESLALSTRLALKRRNNAKKVVERRFNRADLGHA